MPVPRRALAGRLATAATLAVLATGLSACAGAGDRAVTAADAAPPEDAPDATSPDAAPPAAVHPAADRLGSFAGCDDLVAHLRGLARPYVTEHGFGSGVDNRLAGGGYTVPAEPEYPHSGPYTTHGVLVRPFNGNESSLTAGRDNRPVATATNGRLLVAIRGGVLRVVDISGAAPVPRGALDLRKAGFSAAEVLLGERRALVSGHSYADFDGRAHGFGLGLVDLTDPDRPRLEAAELVTGYALSSSIVGDVARVAVSSKPYLVFSEPARGEDGHAALAGNRAIVERARPADWLPSRRMLDDTGRAGPAAPLLGCGSVRYPADDSGLAFVSLLSFDLTRRDALDSPGASAVLADTDAVYAAPDRLYVATYPGAWGRGPDDGKPVPAIPRTAVHRFDAGGAAAAAYAASGAVKGWVPGEWAMAEDGDDLRVVASEGYFAHDTSARTVFVLRRQDADLEQIRRYSGVSREGWQFGWLDGLAAAAPGRDHGVTLIRTTGRSGSAVQITVRVPGFSEFLATDGDHLVAVGEGPAGGGGVQVSAFDISALDTPRRTGTVAFEPRSRAQTEDDAGYSLYLPGRRILVLPVFVPAEGKRWHAALLGVHLGEDGALTQAGRWLGESTSEREWSSRDISFDVLELPGDRIATVEGKRVTVLSAGDLSVRGSAALPSVGRPQ